jgi:hypothetical protein
MMAPALSLLVWTVLAIGVNGQLVRPRVVAAHIRLSSALRLMQPGVALSAAMLIRKRRKKIATFTLARHAKMPKVDKTQRGWIPKVITVAGMLQTNAMRMVGMGPVGNLTLERLRNVLLVAWMRRRPAVIVEEARYTAAWTHVTRTTLQMPRSMTVRAYFRALLIRQDKMCAEVARVTLDTQARSRRFKAHLISGVIVQLLNAHLTQRAQTLELAVSARKVTVAAFLLPIQNPSTRVLARLKRAQRAPQVCLLVPAARVKQDTLAPSLLVSRMIHFQIRRMVRLPL